MGTDNTELAKQLHERLFPGEPIENVQDMVDNVPAELREDVRFPDGGWDWLYTTFQGELHDPEFLIGQIDKFLLSACGNWYAHYTTFVIGGWHGPITDDGAHFTQELPRGTEFTRKLVLLATFEKSHVKPRLRC